MTAPSNSSTPTWKPVSYRNAKAGQQNFLTSSRLGVIFTYDLSDENADTQNPSFLADGTQAVNGVTSDYWGEKDGTALTAGNEIMIGAGIKSIRVEQQINVTQETALGFFDIVETIEHNVASNQMTLDKAALRLQLMSQVGLAPWGKDVLSSPRLNGYILDVKERERGQNVGFLKLIGLHIQTNSFSGSVGQAAMENVTFRIDRIQPVKNIPFQVLADLRKQFPWIYSGLESMPQATILSSV